MTANHYYVFILASKKNGTLYVGVTSNLIRRIYEHKNTQIPGFTSKHSVHTLVHVEPTPDITSVIKREKQI